MKGSVTMLTWRLWRALCSPPSTHPLFQRSTGLPSGTHHLVRQLQITVFYLGSCLILTLIWPLLVSNTPGVLIIGVLSGNSLYAMICAKNISAAIAYEREQATYDLLCLLPTGALGVGLALSSAQMYRSPFFQTTRLIMRLLALALIGALGIALVFPLAVALSSEGGGTSAVELLVGIVQAIALALGLYIDYIQSLILAQMVGMLTPGYTHNRLNAQLVAASAFLSLQLLTYISTLVLVFSLPPLIPSPVISTIAVPLLALIAFFAIREAFIAILWRQFVTISNTSAQEAELDASHRLAL